MKLSKGDTGVFAQPDGTDYRATIKELMGEENGVQVAAIEIDTMGTARFRAGLPRFQSVPGNVPCVAKRQPGCFVSPKVALPEPEPVAAPELAPTGHEAPGGLPLGAIGRVLAEAEGRLGALETALAQAHAKLDAQGSVLSAQAAILKGLAPFAELLPLMANSADADALEDMPAPLRAFLLEHRTVPVPAKPAPAPEAPPVVEPAPAAPAAAAPPPTAS